tara:strand:- start:777 stop:2465 length:1689 start_codon:yes stop_codon:yes gene_type:complete
MQLFGTDGVRGKVEEKEYSYSTALSLYFENRILTPSLLRAIGEAIAIDLGSSNNNTKPVVVIGWDNRPSNPALVGALTEGLTLQGCEVHWAGNIATPGLHYCILESNFCTGLMVTASHNPAHDSGLKIFDEFGFKSYPDREKTLSQIVEKLSRDANGKMYDISEEFRKPLIQFNGEEKHQKALQNRLNLIKKEWGVSLEDAFEYGVVTPNVFIFDSSKGAIHSWLETWLSQNNFNTSEQSTSCSQINSNCGAGEFSPTDRWTWDDLDTNHTLLKAIKNTFKNVNTLIPGQILAAAVDGDADRCLLFEALDDLSGIKVVDGDKIADDILQAAISTDPESNWLFASSIESDLSLVSSLKRLSSKIKSVETAVGDRWLSLALCDTPKPSLISSSKIPNLLGCEDSGHLVLPIQHPNNKGKWSLVGDGLMTFLYTILARCVLNKNGKRDNFIPGWKLRKSVKGVNRSLWDGKNDLSTKAQKIVEDWFDTNSNLTNLSNKEIEGSTSLLLLEGHVEDLPFSLGIRNSGTESKISVSLRLSAGCIDKISNDPLELVNHLCDFLSSQMS